MKIGAGASLVKALVIRINILSYIYKPNVLLIVFNIIIINISCHEDYFC
jgi:hypothetical protein